MSERRQEGERGGGGEGEGEMMGEEQVISGNSKGREGPREGMERGQNQKVDAPDTQAKRRTWV